MRQLWYEIEERPTVLNRGRYRRQWGVRWDVDERPVDPDIRQLQHELCDRTFDNFMPIRYPDESERDHIDPVVVRHDIDRLSTETRRVRDHIEQAMAHRSRQPPDPITWGEFHAAIDVLVEVFSKYYGLLHQSALMGIEPEPQYDTHECFTFPWLPASAETLD